MMLAKRNYRLVADNEFDVRVPLHSDEAFQHGISFHAKYIGSLDVPRPNNRMEIVAAMRRIRYDYKAKGLKKRKVSFQVSVHGVQVSLRPKRKLKEWPLDGATLPFMHHPVYRIFYVSHDSQDLKIFSYIARDASTDFFRCNVFKTDKKSQAMKIVRTVGQAFEVCHKFAATPTTTVVHVAVVEEDEIDDDDDDIDDDEDDEDDDVVGDVFTNSANEIALDQSQPQQDAMNLTMDTPIISLKPIDVYVINEQQQQQQDSQLLQHLQQQQQQQLNQMTSSGTSLALQHEVLLLKQQVEQQQQQTHAAIGQVKLLKDQLAAETAARIDAQARTHQLLIHNKELLDHIQTLVLQMQELETKVAPTLPQMLGLLPSNRLPTLREVDGQHESAALMTSAATSAAGRELQQQQQQLHQQQQEYALLLAQAAQAAHKQLLANFNASGVVPLSHAFFSPHAQSQPCQPIQSLPQPHAPPMASPGGGVSDAGAYHGNRTFILPLGDDALGGATNSDVMRRLQLIGEDSSGGGASVTSLHSSDSDRQRMDSSVESMGSGAVHQSPLHQQLERMRLGHSHPSGDDDNYRSPGGGATLRRNGPFITRSTSEKVPHRNEILAQVQRTAWARHTTK